MAVPPDLAAAWGWSGQDGPELLKLQIQIVSELEAGREAGDTCQTTRFSFRMNTLLGIEN